MKKYLLSLIVPGCARVYIVKEDGMLVSKNSEEIDDSYLGTHATIISNLNSAKATEGFQSILNVFIKAGKAELIEYEQFDGLWAETGVIETIRTDWQIGEDGIYNV